MRHNIFRNEASLIGAALTSILQQQASASDDPVGTLLATQAEMGTFLQTARVDGLDVVEDLRVRAMLAAALAQSVPDLLQELSAT